jgi:fructose-1,6-bisphosphatase/inositol monophosphatase family enzyme
VIVTIHNRQSIVGALAYLPRQDICYIAVDGEGAFVLNSQEMATRESGKPFKFSHTDGPVLLFNRSDLLAKLKPHMDARDLVIEYDDGARGYTSLDLLKGKAIATVMAPCQAIDGGALGFIAQQAGATVTDLKGNQVGSYRSSEKRVVPWVVAAATKERHQQILSILKDLS